MDAIDLNTLFPDYENKMEAKKSKIKKGPKVVHLAYLSQHLSPEDIEGFEKDLSLLDLQLSSYDNSGVPQNSLSGMVSDATLFVTQPGIVGILTSGLLTNAVYDGLKTFIIACWKKVTNKPTVSMTTRTVTERTSRFSMVVKVDDKVTLEFTTESLDESTLKFAIDHISSSLDKFKLSGSETECIGMKYDKPTALWLPSNTFNQPEIIRTVTLDEYIQEINRNSTERSV